MQVHLLSNPSCPLHRSSFQRYEKSQPPPLHSSRRFLFTSSLPLLSLVFINSANSLNNPPAAVTPPTSPLIEQLLERSRANKAKNDQKRLDDYYERNYKEYFEFVEGTIRNKTDLTETEKGILRWLENYRNKKK